MRLKKASALLLLGLAASATGVAIATGGNAGNTPPGRPPFFTPSVPTPSADDLRLRASARELPTGRAASMPRLPRVARPGR
ncbi:MAG: hypothetical protein U1E76_01525 [Planctomycetota bacterium]